MSVVVRVCRSRSSIVADWVTLTNDNGAVDALKAVMTSLNNWMVKESDLDRGRSSSVVARDMFASPARRGTVVAPSARPPGTAEAGPPLNAVEVESEVVEPAGTLAVRRCARRERERGGGVDC